MRRFSLSLEQIKQKEEQLSVDSCAKERRIRVNEATRACDVLCLLMAWSPLSLIHDSNVRRCDSGIFFETGPSPSGTVDYAPRKVDPSTQGRDD